jgi:DNA-binding transcriptional LysR family regulator
MDKFRELTAFVAVVNAGAFNEAARKLALSPSVVTRLIAELETRLDVRLLTRTTRKIALTEVGQQVYHDSLRVLSGLQELEASATGAQQVPQGLLRVTAPVLFGRRQILPILRDFLDEYPEVTASTFFVDRLVDLIDEGMDVAVRIGTLANSSLIGTKVGSVRHVTVASPGYLRKFGNPQTPADLCDHQIVSSTRLAINSEWVFQSKGMTENIQTRPRLQVNTVSAAVESAVVGWGLTRVLSYQVADELASGSLVEILQPFEDREVPIHLLHHEGHLSSAKTRSFINYAADRLRQNLKID